MSKSGAIAPEEEIGGEGLGAFPASSEGRDDDSPDVKEIRAKLETLRDKLNEVRANYPQDILQIDMLQGYIETLENELEEIKNGAIQESEPEGNESGYEPETECEGDIEPFWE
jgi:hypothetical protein